MEQIPDAPWIREAEMYGLPSEEYPDCPVCGKECRTIYLDGSYAIGCEHCIKEVDAADWLEEQKRIEMEEHGR